MLKPSHASTPRTLQDAVFVHGSDPIERPERRPAGVGRWFVFTVLALLALTLIAGVR